MSQFNAETVISLIEEEMGELSGHLTTIEAVTHAYDRLL